MRKSSVPQEETSVQHLESNGKASCILHNQLITMMMIIIIIIIIFVIYLWAVFIALMLVGPCKCLKSNRMG